MDGQFPDVIGLIAVLDLFQDGSSDACVVLEECLFSELFRFDEVFHHLLVRLRMEHDLLEQSQGGDEILVKPAERNREALAPYLEVERCP